MVKEKYPMKMAIPMRVNLKRAKKMAKEISITAKAEIDMRVNSRRTKGLDSEL